jgi:hypothetical protein
VREKKKKIERDERKEGGKKGYDRDTEERNEGRQR